MSIDFDSELCYLCHPLKREPTRWGKALQRSRKNTVLQMGCVRQFYLKKNRLFGPLKKMLRH